MFLHTLFYLLFCPFSQDVFEAILFSHYIYINPECFCGYSFISAARQISKSFSSLPVCNLAHSSVLNSLSREFLFTGFQIVNLC